ncbi:hypothetical protein PR048_032198 [Dryococelus australis]|uniref:Uncharacterized protein n=1 Tax=Dryococelus australis TaxID=614101 RepID=A0ABQ9G1J3_9NEOP|nr:hypothetical protein PR048_032198 [Dryococelus australis]
MRETVPEARLVAFLSLPLRISTSDACPATTTPHGVVGVAGSEIQSARVAHVPFGVRKINSLINRPGREHYSPVSLPRFLTLDEQVYMALKPDTDGHILRTRRCFCSSATSHRKIVLVVMSAGVYVKTGLSAKASEMSITCKCNYECNNIAHDHKLKLFQDFYAMADNEKPNSYLIGLLVIIPVQRRRHDEKDGEEILSRAFKSAHFTVNSLWHPLAYELAHYTMQLVSNKEGVHLPVHESESCARGTKQAEGGDLHAPLPLEGRVADTRNGVESSGLSSRDGGGGGGKQTNVETAPRAFGNYAVANSTVCCGVTYRTGRLAFFLPCPSSCDCTFDRKFASPPLYHPRGNNEAQATSANLLSGGRGSIQLAPRACVSIVFAEKKPNLTTRILLPAHPARSLQPIFTARLPQLLILFARRDRIILSTSSCETGAESAKPGRWTQASKVKERGSDTGDTNTHVYCLIAPTRKACSVSVVRLYRDTRRHGPRELSPAPGRRWESRLSRRDATQLYGTGHEGRGKRTRCQRVLMRAYTKKRGSHEDDTASRIKRAITSTSTTLNRRAVMRCCISRDNGVIVPRESDCWKCQGKGRVGQAIRHSSVAGEPPASCRSVAACRTGEMRHSTGGEVKECSQIVNLFLLSVAPLPTARGSGGAVARALASRHGDLDSIPGSLHVAIVLNDAACRWVFSGCSRLTRSCIPAPLHSSVSFSVMSGDDGHLRVPAGKLRSDYWPPNKVYRVRFPAGSLPDFSPVGIVPHDATGRRGFLGVSLVSSLPFHQSFKTYPIKRRRNLSRVVLSFLILGKTHLHHAQAYREPKAKFGQRSLSLGYSVPQAVALLQSQRTSELLCAISAGAFTKSTGGRRVNLARGISTWAGDERCRPGAGTMVLITSSALASSRGGRPPPSPSADI